MSQICVPTPMQRTMLLQSLVGRNAGHYLLQMTGRLEESVVPEAFAEAWQYAMDRHDALRASFDWSHADDPHASFAERVDVPFRLVDVRGASADEKDAQWQAFLAEDRAVGFEIGRPPLLRVTLFQMGAADFRFCWTVHHALVDGRSLVLVLREVFAAYELIRAGKPLDRSARTSFAHYLDYLASEDVSAQQEHLRSTFEGIQPAPPLRIESEAQGRVRPIELEGALAEGETRDLETLAEELDVTLHTLVQVAWCGVLRAIQGENDEVLLGATRAGRHIPFEGADSLVGLLINTLPVRVRVGRDTTVRALAEELRRQSLELREHEHVSLHDLWASLGLGGAPFRSIVVAENFDFETVFQNDGEAWTHRRFELLERSETLTLGARLGDHLSLSIQFEEPRIRTAAGRWMLDQLVGVLRALPASADAPLRSLCRGEAELEGLVAEVSGGGRARARELRPEERAQILEEWNRTTADFAVDELVHDRIAAHAHHHPERVAVEDPDGTLSYGELDRVANRLACQLAELGVGPESRVAVCMPTSRSLVAAYLAVLRAGGAYVPIDPGNPDERIRFVLEDSSAVALLTSPGQCERFTDVPCPVIEWDIVTQPLPEENDEPPASNVGPRNLVYVIYTSGSTGTPKGVQIEHRHLANLCGVYQARLGVGPQTRSSAVAGMAFDAAVVDIWPYLVCGASVHVPPSEVRSDPRRLVPWLREQQIDVTSLPTALGEATFREDWSGHDRLRVMLVGGDKLHGPPRTKLPFTLYNTYGPTECTVDSTWFAVDTGVDDSTPPPIGRPIENYRAYVVDAEGRPLPVGEKGELWMGGAGVARGYLNRPELDAEKFLSDPFVTDPEARVYRTGDLVCFRPNGDIEFHGRIDDQVQIRGFRVEPGEVAAALSEHEDVEAAAVVAREDRPGKVRLVAYVVSAKPADEVLTALRAFAAERLPPYMVPTMVSVEELPMTLNGKVDRKALRPPEEYDSFRGEVVAEPPADEMEARLVEIWRSVLDLDDVGTNEGFFDLGGDSLSVVNLLVAVETEFGVEVQVPELLRDPTVRSLARILRGEAPVESRAVIVPLQPDGDLAPFFCVAGAGGGCHWFGELVRELRHDRPFLGLEPTGASGVEHTIEMIAAGLVEEIRRIQPTGPYHLGGYSTGGVVAFEIAQQLRAAGETIGLLALIEGDGGRDYSTRAGQIVTFAKNLLHLDASRAIRVVLDRATFALGAMRHWVSQDAESRVVEAKIDARKQEDEEALHRYVPKPYPGDLRFFACTERPMTATSDEAYGWGDIVAGKIVASRVPGDHYTMLAHPNVRTLATDLQAALDATEARRESWVAPAELDA